MKKKILIICVLLFLFCLVFVGYKFINKKTLGEKIAYEDVVYDVGFFSYSDQGVITNTEELHKLVDKIESKEKRISFSVHIVMPFLNSII